MSRPPESERATSRLNARAVMARSIPAIEMLRDKLRPGSDGFDKNRLNELAEQALTQIDNLSPDLATAAAIAAVGSDDPVAKAIANYLEAARRETGAAALCAELDWLKSQASIEQRSALLQVVLASAKAEAPPNYIIKFVDQLLSAGLKSEIQRGLSKAQIAAIKAIVHQPKPSKQVVASPQAEFAPTVLPNSTSLWAALPNPIPGYTFEVRRAAEHRPLDKAILDAGLPPMTSLDLYQPGASITLANMAEDREKAAFTWTTVAKWLVDRGAADKSLERHRYGAWRLLLGHVHGFLDDMPGITKTHFASPWSSDEIIYATRVPTDSDEI